MNDIKLYLEEKKLVIKNHNKPQVKEVFEFKLEFNNGIDFVIARYRNKKLQQELIFIPSQNKINIRGQKVERPAIGNKKVVQDFFMLHNYSQSTTELNNISLELNPYFHNALHKKLFYLAEDNNQVHFKFLKYGLNIFDYLGEYDDLRNLDVDRNIKIIYLVRDILGDALKSKCNSKLLKTIIFFSDNFNFNISKYLLEKMNGSNLEVFNIGSDNYDRGEFISLVKEYNIDITKFIDYVFDNLNYQGVTKIDYSFIRDYRDYLENSKIVYGKIKDKYPNYFKTEHDRVAMLFNMNKKEYEDKKIKIALEKALKYEYKGKEYSIISPKCTQDIVNEGISLHHCVATYVPKVVDGRNIIMFLRSTEDLDTSLLTISICSGVVNQVRGLSQARPSDSEWEFIQKWAKKFELESNRDYI
jgi:hypothetical protein